MPETLPSGPAGGGRTIVLTPDEVTQVEALAAVLSAEQIAGYFGIGRTTLREIMERQPEVAERYKKGRARAINAVARGLLQKALDGDTASAIFYLKTQAGWRETAQIDHTNSDSRLTPTRIEIVSHVRQKGDAVLDAIRAKHGGEDQDSAEDHATAGSNGAAAR